MHLVINNRLVVSDYQPNFKKWCDQNLKFTNPDYAKKERMGLWLGQTPKHIQLYQKNGNTLILPYGVAKAVKKMCDTAIGDIPSYDKVLTSYTQGLKLYDYQAEAVTAMQRAVYGILQAPAGSGKTLMGVSLACKLGLKTLWIADKIDLVNQAVATAKQFVSANKIGTITEGKVNIGEFITFATIQTLSKLDLQQYRYMFGAIFVDECHGICSNANNTGMFQKVLDNLACWHKYGLSATVHRADGLIGATKALIGDIVHEIPLSAVKDKIMTVDIQPISLPTEMNLAWLDSDGTVNHSKLINGLCENFKRNKIIVEKVVENKENYNLILTDRVGHIESLQSDLLKLGVSCVSINGKTPKKAREQAITDMREGKYNCLIATYSLAKQGLDIQCLDRLHLATPQKDYAVITQSCGRIARSKKDKQQPVCYDYVDVEIQSLVGKYKKRCTIYRKNNYKILEKIV